jgi:uncharacterized membrane protein
MNDASTGRLETILSRVLKVGALTSTSLMAAGLVLQLAGVDLSLSATLTRAGLVVLMATPVARVVVSVGDFAMQNDWVFLGLTGTVLIILIGSLVIAIR